MLGGAAVERRIGRQSALDVLAAWSTPLRGLVRHARGQTADRYDLFRVHHERFIRTGLVMSSMRTTAPLIPSASSG